MERNAKALVDQLHRDNSPEDLLDGLTALSHSLWTRNAALIQLFCELGGLERLVHFLRPRSLVELSNELVEIRISLHGDSRGPSTVVDTWRGALRGMAAEAFGRLCQNLPGVVFEIVFLDHAWLVDMLVTQARRGSDMERYGAIVALEALAAKGEIREQWLDRPEIAHVLAEFLQLVNRSANPSTRYDTSIAGQKILPPRLFSGIRWRLAGWRAALQLLNILCVRHDVDLYESAWDVLPLRHHWKSLVSSHFLVQALVGTIRFAADSVPKTEEGNLATVFSGPGIFRGSAIQVRDVAPVVRSVLFLLTRLGANEPCAKTQLMHQEGLTFALRRLAIVFDEHGREDIVQFLLFLGIGAAMKLTKADNLTEMVASSNATESFRCLKMLAHGTEVLDCEQMLLFLVHKKGTGKLLDFVRAEVRTSEPQVNLHEKIGRLLVQRSPLRDATILNPNTSWKSLKKSYALFALGRMSMQGMKSVARAVMQERTWLFPVVQQLLKTGTELERWGALQALAGILVAAQLYPELQWSANCLLLDRAILAPLCIRQLNICISAADLPARQSSKVTTPLFQNSREVHWLLESWRCSVHILDWVLFRASDEGANPPLQHSSLSTYLTDVIFALVSALGQIASIGERIANDPEQLNLASQIAYHALNVLLSLQRTHLPASEVLKRQESLPVIETYLNFADADARRQAHRLLKALLEDLLDRDVQAVKRMTSLRSELTQDTQDETRELEELRYFRLSLRAPLQQISNLLNANKVSGLPRNVQWPQQVPLPLYDFFMRDSNTRAFYEESRPNERWSPFASVTKCANKDCWNKEMRRGQFLVIQEKHYCSKACVTKTTPAHFRPLYRLS